MFDQYELRIRDSIFILKYSISTTTFLKQRRRKAESYGGEVSTIGRGTLQMYAQLDFSESKKAF